MKREFSFLFLLVLVLLFSISCDFKKEDENSNDEIINDNENIDEEQNIGDEIGKVNPDDKYQKVPDDQKKEIVRIQKANCFFGFAEHDQGYLVFSHAINNIKNIDYDGGEITFYLTEFSSDNIYYIGVYYVDGERLVYRNYITEDDINCIYITDLNDIPDTYNNKKFSFVLEVRDFTLKKDLLTDEDINYHTKVYLPLLVNTDESTQKSKKEVFEKAYAHGFPRYFVSKYYGIQSDFFDWEGEYVICSYQREVDELTSLSCNELFFGMLKYTCSQGYDLYEYDGVKYIKLVNFLLDDIEKTFFLNGIMKGYECDTFVDEMMQAVCSEEEVCNFENNDVFLYIKYDDFINSLLETINS